MSKRQRDRSMAHMPPEPMNTLNQHSRPLENNGEASAASYTFPSCLPEEIQRMIAIAAYFRAERRCFAPGHEMEDWLAAEADIEKQTGTAKT